MNLNEARLALHEELAEVLTDLTDEDGTATPEELAEVRDAMGDAVDIIFEALDLEVISVTDGKVTVTIDLG